MYSWVGICENLMILAVKILRDPTGWPFRKPSNTKTLSTDDIKMTTKSPKTFVVNLNTKHCLIEN